MNFQWSGLIGLIPGYLPDNSDQWTQVSINAIRQALPATFSGVAVVVDPADYRGLQGLHVTGAYNGNGDPQIILTNAVAGSGVNLDLNSVLFSSTASPGVATQPPPMVIDYTAPYAPPLPSPMQPADIAPEPLPVVPVTVLPTPVTATLPPVTQTQLPPVSTPVVPVVTTPVPVTTSLPAATNTLPAVTQTTQAAAAAKPAISPALIVVGIIALLFLSSGK